MLLQKDFLIDAFMTHKLRIASNHKLLFEKMSLEFRVFSRDKSYLNRIRQRERFFIDIRNSKENPSVKTIMTFGCYHTSY